MATTLGDVLLSLAYRLGETSSPTDTDERARRVSFIVDAYRQLLRRNMWWWTEALTSFNSVADQEEYTTSDGFPSDYRDMLELRVDDFLYTSVSVEKITSLYDKNNTFFNYDEIVAEKHWYIFANTLHILPKTPANGTNNITMKYYKNPTMPSANTDVLLIPDQYVSGLDAYAYGRIKQNKGKRGEASDGFNEFTAMLTDMQVEQNKRTFWNKSVRPINPVYLVD